MVKDVREAVVDVRCVVDRYFEITEAAGAFNQTHKDTVDEAFARILEELGVPNEDC